MINSSKFLKPKRKYKKKKNVKLSKKNKNIINNLQNNYVYSNNNNLNYRELQNRASFPDTFDKILLFNEKIKFEEKKYFMKIKLNIEHSFNKIINEFKIISEKLNNLVKIVKFYKSIININFTLNKLNNNYIKYLNKKEYDSLICHELFYDNDYYNYLNNINLCNIT